MNTDSIMDDSGFSASRSPAIHRSVTPSAPYSGRPPTPPFVNLYRSRRVERETNDDVYTLVPCVANLSALQLTREELRIVTRDQEQRASDAAASWMYEQRRGPQPVLDYISIGPTHSIRDHDFLERNNVSMVVVVRDARMANMRSLSVENACKTFNIKPAFINIDPNNPLHLIHELPAIVRTLNRHMIDVHNQSQMDEMEAPRTGHILMTCDSGNERSAAIVTAYIMAVYGASMHKAAYYLHRRRFSCSFDEDTKRMLQTWEELLQAQAAVSADREVAQQRVQPPKSKRGIDDMMASGIHTEGGTAFGNSDEDRFQERRFAPFKDSEVDM